MSQELGKYIARLPPVDLSLGQTGREESERDTEQENETRKENKGKRKQVLGKVDVV